MEFGFRDLLQPWIQSKHINLHVLRYITRKIRRTKCVFFSVLGALKQTFSIQVYHLLFSNSDSQGTPVVNLIQLAGDDLEWFVMQFSKDDVEKRGLSI